MSEFFIDRPVFAWVISIVIMLSGVLSIFALPVEQYPVIAPPTVSITATYPGASAETLENSVTQVIEQALVGLDHLRYFRSSSDSTGNVEIKLTFEPKADADTAQVQVQNKLQSVMSQLPNEVRQQGVTVAKVNDAFMMIVGLCSDDGKVDAYALGDYMTSRLTDPIGRLPGVGSLVLFGQPYSMRIWLDPHKLNSFNLSTMEVQAAVQAQNMDVSVGQWGGMPAVPGQELNATITAQSRLKTVEDFEKIILRVNPDGSQVRLKDVARLELGVQNYDIAARYQGKPATGMAVTLATGGNALETARLVKEKLEELSAFMPAGVKVIYPYDTTPFVRLSIKEVVKTLVEAIFLVFLVMYLFLQNFRATLIPAIAIPVVLLGTFGILAAFGFSINTLTMFAMVLSIGLLVDDAIVVVENVERIMAEEGLPPKEATRKSMRQITGALVGIALVLSAVFVPMAFFSGSTGAIYRQFSLTIVSAMGLSILVAMILAPALCATLLKARGEGHIEKTTGFFGWFNRNFNRSRQVYRGSAHYVTMRTVRFIVIYVVILGGLAFLFQKIPTAFLPDEDQGVMFVQVATPAGATTERTLESVKAVEQYFLTQEKDMIDSIFMITGFSFSGRGQNTAIASLLLKNWKERHGEGQDVFSLSQRTMERLSTLKDAMVFAFYPPAVNELGDASGFDFQLLDRAGLGHEALIAAQNQLLGMAAQTPKLQGVRPNGLADVPQYKIDIDREKAGALGLSLADVNATMQIAWGSLYINDFLDGNRIKKVFMQGDAPYRMSPNNEGDWHVRNTTGEMVPFTAFSSGKWTYGPQKLERHNGVSSMNIQGAPAPGVSSGEAMSMMEDMAGKLPDGIGYEWTGLSYEERAAGAQTPLLYSLSLLIVFLCLAALYESWSIPFAVMLVVPLGVFGSVVATYFSGLSNDVYFQVGLLTTIGLASKDAILIVEFAKAQYEKGTDLIEASMIAAEQRLRPILMTSMAFILGVTPLALAGGAGSASQNAIGVGVIGGMFAATFLAIFFVPMFFILIQKRFGKRLHAPMNTDLQEISHAG
jgi:HAE1 family hydrophobic/amphiphilic exporter-1/multidrug efflux pump